MHSQPVGGGGAEAACIASQLGEGGGGRDSMYSQPVGGGGRGSMYSQPVGGGKRQHV